MKKEKWENVLLKAAGEEPIEEEEKEESKNETSNEIIEPDFNEDSIPKDILFSAKQISNYTFSFKDKKTFKGFFESALKRKGWINDGIISKDVQGMIPEYKKEALLIYLMRNIIKTIEEFRWNRDVQLELSSLYRSPNKDTNYPNSSRFTSDAFKFTKNFDGVMYAFNLKLNSNNPASNVVICRDQEFLKIYIKHIAGYEYAVSIVMNVAPVVEFNEIVHIDIEQRYQFWSKEFLERFAKSLNAKARQLYLVYLQKTSKKVALAQARKSNELHLEDIF